MELLPQGFPHRCLRGWRMCCYVRLTEIDEVPVGGRIRLNRPILGRRRVGVLGPRLACEDGSYGENLLGFDLRSCTVTTSISSRIDEFSARLTFLR